MSHHLESYEVKLINVDISVSFLVNSKIYSIIAYVTISNGYYILGTVNALHTDMNFGTGGILLCKNIKEKNNVMIG